MKTNEPKIIYLQIGDDADIAEFKPEDFETNAITWCWERIFKNDIEYVSKQSILALVDEEKIKQVAIDDSQQDWNELSFRQVHEEAFIKGANWILTELKQKIEEL